MVLTISTKIIVIGVSKPQQVLVYEIYLKHQSAQILVTLHPLAVPLLGAKIIFFTNLQDCM